MNKQTYFQESLLKKINSGCYLSQHDRDNIVSDLLKLQELVYNQQQEINELKGLNNK
jgi:hypothetical protein